MTNLTGKVISINAHNRTCHLLTDDGQVFVAQRKDVSGPAPEVDEVLEFSPSPRPPERWRRVDPDTGAIIWHLDSPIAIHVRRPPHSTNQEENE